MIRNWIEKLLGVSTIPYDGETVDTPCMNCGSDRAILLHTPLQPDFDPHSLPIQEIRSIYSDRRDGICTICGIYQSYRRPNAEQIKQMNRLGKDITTSESAFHEFPVPPNFQESFRERHFTKRLTRWEAAFTKHGIHPCSALFLRVWFGDAPYFVAQRYGASIAGLDMSPACLRTTQDKVPNFQTQSGYLNGALEGEFLCSGPYDAVFVFHVLTHSCDIHSDLRKIRALVAAGGVAIFTHEAVRKPNNPFHMIHPSELQFRTLLEKYFSRVVRIDDCGTVDIAQITRYSEKGDEADLIAFA